MFCLTQSFLFITMLVQVGTPGRPTMAGLCPVQHEGVGLNGSPEQMAGAPAPTSTVLESWPGALVVTWRPAQSGRRFQS